MSKVRKICKLTLVVQGCQLLQEKLHSVGDILIRNDLATLLIGADVVTLLRFATLVFVENLWEVVRNVTEGTLDFKTSYRSVLKLLGGLCLHHRGQYVGVVILVFSGVLVELVFLSINTEALGNEIDLDSFDVFYQTSDWRQKLLGDIPVGVDFEFILTLLFGL